MIPQIKRLKSIYAPDFPELLNEIQIRDGSIHTSANVSVCQPVTPCLRSTNCGTGNDFYIRSDAILQDTTSGTPENICRS
ncbi:kynureninase [Moniliophthora roreri]|nr:kynureninase [Moniliophthora roreri]